MGHLTRISNMVVQNLEKGPVQAQITDLIKGNQRWMEASARPYDDRSLSLMSLLRLSCRAAGGLQRSLGELRGRDPERNQPEEHGGAGETHHHTAGVSYRGRVEVQYEFTGVSVQC